ncbi:relaxosome protein TraM [Ewingella americana]|uniref:relaxosome protein TraM n=1 Tax=Ewingella americana TaxID=41202 RepID=UPI001639EE8D|nr:relaxosome protein TraM [Ewingella americana]QMV54169.1 hypothetical protein GXP68_23115 [Ewingella americana]
MGRLAIYVKDKIENEIREIVQLEIQNGAKSGEVNISSTCNEILRLGLIMHKARNTEETFNQREWSRDVIRMLGGSQEGIKILLTMVTEMYVNMLGDKGGEKVEEYLSQYLTAIQNAEEAHEAKHFVSSEEE